MSASSSSASVSSLGVGSGLDLNGLLDKLMQAEQQPLVLIQQQESSYQTKISAYGTVSGKLSALQSASDSLKSSLALDVYQAASSSSAVASATTSVGAAVGTYNVHVGNLATNHTLASSPFAATSTVIGTGTLRIGVGTSTFDVAIGNSNNTLLGIRDAINASSSNTGVNASIITDVNGSHLTLTSKNTGSTNAISVAVSETGTTGFTSTTGDPLNSDNAGLSQLAYVTGAATNLTEAQPASDASLTINGIPITSSSNTLSSAVSGVTINLTQKGDTTLTVSRDMSAINSLVNGFISAFNDAQTTIRGMSAYDATTKSGGVLNGEGTARSIPQQLTQTLWKKPSTVTGTYQTFSDIGISLAKDGTLSVNSTKLQTALTTDFASTQSVLNGYAAAMSGLADNITGTGGSLTSRVNGLNSGIKLLTDRASQLSTRLDALQARYKAQFVGLDTMVSQMNQTSTYLSQQLAKL